MNEYVPDSLSNVDKISPKVRSELLEHFWERVGDRPFDNVAPGFFEGFWRPQGQRLRQLAPVALGVTTAARVATDPRGNAVFVISEGKFFVVDVR